MEELQDAIEDAQYMNAMHDGIPRPTKAWPKVTQEELQTYISNLEKNYPTALNIDTICEGSLGFYFFTKFVKENGSFHEGNFLLDVAQFRGHLTENLLETAKTVNQCYLIKDSVGSKESKERRPHNLRHLSPLNPLPEETISLWESCIQPGDFADRRNIIGITGDIVNEVNTSLAQLSNWTAGTENAITISLFDELDRIIFHNLKTKHTTAFKESTYWTKYHEFIFLSEKPVTEDDFSLFRVLGRGGFGMVSGCKKAQTGKLFAMKVMNKKRVKSKKAEALCLNERNILTFIDSEFVVCMKYSFANTSDVFLILDLMTGGDLGFHLSRKGKFTMTETKYYTARLILGVKALHEQAIVYRDLKPENILMGEDGRTKLSDLGLACRVSRSGLTGTCGTRGYWAPEMLRKDANGKRERYGLSVDWFSLGCCIYEFICGISPFRTDRARKWGEFPKAEKADKDRAIDLAIKEMEPEFDSSFDEESKDLISKLLVKDGKTRLGAQSPAQIMAHPWFGNIDWANINFIPPPYVPSKEINMATQSEIGTFTDEKSFKKIDLLEEDQKVYEKWDFLSTKFFQDEITEFLRFEDALGPIIPIDPGAACCCTVI